MTASQHFFTANRQNQKLIHFQGRDGGAADGRQPENPLATISRPLHDQPLQMGGNVAHDRLPPKLRR